MNVGCSYMGVGDDIVFAVHRSVHNVVESVRLSFFVQLSTVGVCGAFHKEDPTAYAEVWPDVPNPEGESLSTYGESPENQQRGIKLIEPGISGGWGTYETLDRHHLYAVWSGRTLIYVYVLRRLYKATTRLCCE